SGARHALHRAKTRAEDAGPRRRGNAAASQRRYLHAADFLHRPAGGGRAGAARAAADWGADHRCAVARGRGAAHRSCAGGRQGGRGAEAAAMEQGLMNIDLPEVMAEVREAFEAYERALVSNDVAALAGFFRDDARTIRYGVGENLYGYEAIKAFRAARSAVGLARTRSKT